MGIALAAVAVAWLLGIALQLTQPMLWPAWHYGAIAAAGVAAALTGRRSMRWSGVAIAGAAAIGFGVTGLHAGVRLGDSLDPALEGRDIVLTGTIAKLPQRHPNGVRFRFDVESAALDGQAVSVPQRLSLGWYGAAHEDAAAVAPQSDLRAGQRWRFTARLRRPHGHMNPHGFDFELWLFEQGIRATGYVRDAPALLLERAAAHPVERARQSIRDSIEARIADRRASGLIAALAVGDQGAIAAADWEVFRDTGIAHLVSVSGMYVTLDFVTVVLSSARSVTV